jgi:hypothetical protein
MDLIVPHLQTTKWTSLGPWLVDPTTEFSEDILWDSYKQDVIDQTRGPQQKRKKPKVSVVRLQQARAM